MENTFYTPEWSFQPRLRRLNSFLADFCGDHRSRKSAMKRGKPFSRKFRDCIESAHEGLCAYCGSPLDQHWQIDHIYPKSMGGKCLVENLVASCKSCNAMKKNRSLHYMRLCLSIKNSKFDGILTVGQVIKLFEIGHDLGVRPVSLFAESMEANDG